MGVTKPYDFIGSGAMDVWSPKPRGPKLFILSNRTKDHGFMGSKRPPHIGGRLDFINRRFLVGLLKINNFGRLGAQQNGLRVGLPG
jgi:hypothetical protein